jgi:mannose-6-phosphate isomerase-like protein (cupin superfamily)
VAAPDLPVNLDEKFALFSDHWAPKVVGAINDLHIKLVKVEGEFVWHSHEDTDEFFLVRKGEMTIEMNDRPDVTLRSGDFFVVPCGVEHRPVADSECEVLVLEPAGVVNTGDAKTSDMTSVVEWI